MKSIIRNTLIAAAALAVVGALAVPAGAAKPRSERPERARVEKRVERPAKARVEKRGERPREVRVERWDDRRRDDGRGRGDRGNVRIERHRRGPVVVHHRGWAPPPSWRRVVVRRAWYRHSPVVYVHDSPFYLHAGFGIYLGGLALEFEVGDVAPDGFAFYDPYCGELFFSMENYHRHLRWHRHEPALTVIRIDDCGY